jgi:hypothetical protein
MSQRSFFGAGGGGGGGGTFTWQEINSSQTAIVNYAYITNSAGAVTVTLPAAAIIGQRVMLVGKGAGGWVVGQNAGQTIHFGKMSTTTGVGGSLASTLQRDVIELVCVTQDTDFCVIDSVGDITVV